MQNKGLVSFMFFLYGCYNKINDPLQIYYFFSPFYKQLFLFSLKRGSILKLYRKVQTIFYIFQILFFYLFIYKILDNRICIFLYSSYFIITKLTILKAYNQINIFILNRMKLIFKIGYDRKNFGFRVIIIVLLKTKMLQKNKKFSEQILLLL